MPTKLFIIAATLVTLGCAADEFVTREVASHVFRLPNRNLVSGGIPSFSSERPGGLIFTVNPDDPLRERINVLIEPKDVLCGNRPLNPSAQLTWLCSENSVDVPTRLEAGRNQIEKVYQGDIRTQWDYTLRANQQGSSSIVATCYATENRGGGNCLSLGRYRDLIYSIWFSENKMRNLASIHRNCIAKLSSWEVRSL